MIQNGQISASEGLELLDALKATSDPSTAVSVAAALSPVYTTTNFSKSRSLLRTKPST